MKKAAVLLLVLLALAACSKPAPEEAAAPPADTRPAVGSGAAGGEGQEAGGTVVEPSSLEELIRLREGLLEKGGRAREPKSALKGIVAPSIRGTVDKPDHGRYLDEPMVFSGLPENPFPGQKIAVVASDGVELHEDFIVSIQSDRDEIWDRLEKGDPPAIAGIPIGTVLPLHGVYQDPKVEGDAREYMDGLLRFRDDLNWFYRTEYQGKKGIVWGAGLRGVTLRRTGNDYSGPFDDEIHTLDSAEIMRLSYYYSKPRKGRIWVPFAGSRPLGGGIVKTLEHEHVAFEQTVYGSDYNLWIEAPDDLLSLYLEQREDPAQTAQRPRSEHDPNEVFYDRNRGIPTFLTTDLVAHSLHLLFDRLLTQVEEERLLLVLGKLVGRLREQARGLPAGSEVDPLRKSAARLVSGYFDVAEALVRMTPPPAEMVDEDGRPSSRPMEDVVNTASLLGQYPEEVQNELRLILAADEAAISPILLINLDYTQFKPRGHYTKSEGLRAYFRAMQWLGQAQFDIDPQRTPPKSEDISDEDLTALHGLAVFLLNRMLIDDPKAFSLWEQMYEPITYLVGAADDIVPPDTIPLLEPLLSRNPDEWSSREKVLAILAEIGPKLKEPGIQGGSILGGTVDGEAITPFTEQGERELIPRTFRLLGPRFTLDSWFFHRLSGHRILGDVPRNMVRGLDVVALLGSRSAEQLLAEERASNPGYRTAYERLKAEVTAFPPEIFQGTYYGQCLDLVGRLAAFDSDSGFFFTHRPLWDTKAMLTSHAAWAELRHDTLLYSKQSAAEKAGNGGYNPTYTTRDFPMQVHYIEPNIRFFYALRGVLRSLREGARDFMPREYALKLADFTEVVEVMTGIAEKEVLDQPITDEENGFILDIPAYLSKIVLPAGSFEWVEDRDQLKMAIVADVHTNALDGEVLEVATGMPYRIYVALNDGQGGRRIAVGYTYSYYEFARPMDERLTDEEWKAIVYPAGTYRDPPVPLATVVEKLRPYQPDWLRGRVP